ncbi:molybdenum cofactor biosynthesis protein MoaE [Sapientia aquatica]|uniref:Molybdopterin synthase catalytic subunit n=1 Tax=Sapientia aquatica TaxID=1549640 RepID=A0A4V3AV09_9BURK|nr:molybdenum cofactor biosynthesis protein MoaE [Sapientia aquatica]TDK67598.1 molybdenum cofactor biosynthesis protein MoaE [Sapientia aquatica]
MKIAIQTNDFDVSAELAQLRIQHRDVDALASFVGTVREVTKGVNDVEVTQMELEHYPGMTEKSLTVIAQQAIERWKLKDAVIIHRVGVLQVTEQIVLVIAASKHRGDAFAACEFMMDYLKTDAPFWKKETTATGAHWVDARSSDVSALDKWTR